MNFVWDRGAQTVHGIGLDLLQEMGLAPLDVVRKQEHSLGDAVVFTDSPIADGHWLGLLYAAADHPQRPSESGGGGLYHVAKRIIDRPNRAVRLT